MSRADASTVEVTADGTVIRHHHDVVGNDLTATLSWCATHNEAVWIYTDGSYGCPHDTVVEAQTEHDLVELPWLEDR